MLFGELHTLREGRRKERDRRGEKYAPAAPIRDPTRSAAKTATSIKLVMTVTKRRV
jgi:hypothetical protein